MDVNDYAYFLNKRVDLEFIASALLLQRSRSFN